MARIRARNTKPELVIRRALHALGYRYRLHDRKLPGCPDLVLPRHRAVIFVHGCFWHGHDCGLFRVPATRPEFWAEKIEGNRIRDEAAAAALRRAGWRVLTIWECSLRGRSRLGLDDTVQHIVEWLQSADETGEVRGK